MMSSALELGELATHLMRLAWKQRYANAALDRHQSREPTMSDDPEARGNKAMALMCAAVCWRGDPTDSEGMLGLADEFLQYIEGDDAIMPRPDKRLAGKLPNPRGKR